MALAGTFVVPHPPVIIPDVGKGQEKKVSATLKSYHEAARRIAALAPDTIIVTSPHSTMYSDYFHISPGKAAKGDFGRFGAGSTVIRAEYDEEFTEMLEYYSDVEGIRAGTLGESNAELDHGTIVPLYFINEYLKDYKLVRIGLSGLSNTEHYRLGKCIAKTAERLERRVVLVASGDLSHRLKEDGPYGFAEEGVRFDKELTQAMKEGDFLKFMEFSPDLCEAAAECGLRSFIIMAGALDGKELAPELLSYEGTFGVGYAVCEFKIIGDSAERNFDRIFTERQKEIAERSRQSEDPYVCLARLSLETYIRLGKCAKLPEDLPEEMLRKERKGRKEGRKEGMEWNGMEWNGMEWNGMEWNGMEWRRAGVFVSLKKHGSLRGCIGTISPAADNIAGEILRNAISSGTEDPRFAPVTKEELCELIYSVDVLGEAEHVKDSSDLDVKRYGVIVTSGRKRGLLLPNLEGVDTVEQQISIAKEKAGIYGNEKFSMERFEVVRHK